MRQRLGLAVALLRKPRLLLLDEPANGLDPAGIREFRTLLRQLASEGVSVFLSSHLLGEVEQVCDRVAIIDRGRLVAVGTTAELGRGEERVRVTLRPGDEPAAIAVLAGAGLTARREGEQPGTLLVDSASGRDVNMALSRGEIFAEAVGLARSGLEERFLAITNRSTGAPPLGSPDPSGELGRGLDGLPGRCGPLGSGAISMDWQLPREGPTPKPAGRPVRPGGPAGRRGDTGAGPHEPLRRHGLTKTARLTR